ncbi:MAG: ISAs1 family transposase [Chloroflexi bacterium]|nr:ISAs1 family transposase [Chloroflexota bacterium]
MDQPQYTTLTEALKFVPDPRHARGKRYAWLFLLTLIAAAMISGQKTVNAIADWVQVHAEELRQALNPSTGRMPSGSTFYRTVRQVDLVALEAQLSEFAEPLAREKTQVATITTADGQMLQGQAFDGKEVRGSQAHGQPLTLVSLVQHETGITLAQVETDTKSNEIPAAAQLLAGRDLTNTVTTMDALHTQRALAQQILDQHGQYFMVVKENQPTLYQAIELLFEQPPWLAQERAQQYHVYTYANKGHGRREKRCLESSPSLNTFVDFPGVGQVMRRQCERVIVKTGEISRETRYGITSLRFVQASAQQLELLWRRHWTIENRDHYVRDVTLGEDACQVHTGHAAHALATFRNTILSLFRWKSWDNIASAVRYYAASVTRALGLIGALSP